MVKSVKIPDTPLQRPTQAERTAKAEEKMVNATIELLNTVGLAGTTLMQTVSSVIFLAVPVLARRAT